MKDSGLKWVGQIPADWEVDPLYKFVRQVKRINVGNREKNLLSLSYGTIKRKDMEAASGLVPESYAGYNIIEAGDIVLRLTDLQNDKRSIRVGRSTERGIVTSAYVTIRPSKECSSEYLRYSVLGFDIAKGFYGIGSGVRQGLTYDEVKKLSFPFPPLPEQRAIAAKLDAQTSRIESESKKITAEIARLDAYKKSVITEVVCRGLDPKVKMKDSGIPWIGKIPEEWRVCKIASLYELRSEKVSDKDYPPLSVTMKGVLPQLENVAKTNDGDNRKLVRAGDFAINSRSDRRGACGIAKQDGSVSLINIVLKPRSSIDNGYFDWLFHTIGFADEFYKWGTGIVADMWSTRWQSMKKIGVPFPPQQEQKAIAAAITATCARVDAIIAKRKRQLDRLDALKRSLVYEYVTGKKEV